MRKAKLSGSLLAQRKTRPVIEQEQSRRVSGRMTVNQSFAFPAAFMGAERQGRDTARGASLAIGGVAIAAMIAIVLLQHPSEQIPQRAPALSTNPQSQNASEPAQSTPSALVTPGEQATAANPAPMQVPVASTPISTSTTVAAPAASPAPVTLPLPAPSTVVSDHQSQAAGENDSPHSEPLIGIAALPEHQSRDTRASQEDVSALRARGDALFGNGDIVSARLFYERAAEGGDGQAALRLGESYDPAFLKQAGITGIRGDNTTANRWYLQALELGVSEASILLKRTTDR